jgi:hypothetical protein
MNCVSALNMGVFLSCVRTSRIGRLLTCSPDQHLSGTRYRPLTTSAAQNFKQSEWEQLMYETPRKANKSVRISEKHACTCSLELFRDDAIRKFCFAVEPYHVPTTRITAQLKTVLNARDLAEACKSIAPGTRPCLGQNASKLAKTNRNGKLFPEHVWYRTKHAHGPVAGRVLRAACPISANEVGTRDLDVSPYKMSSGMFYVLYLLRCL